MVATGFFSKWGRLWPPFIIVIAALISSRLEAADEIAQSSLTIEWKDNFLTLRGERLPEEGVKTWYLEAYCRANSHETDWVEHTVVPHRTELIEQAEDGRRLKLRCTVADGLRVEHTLSVEKDAVDIRIRAHNPTERRSEVHWAQPCMRVGTFTGFGPDKTNDKYAYLQRSFIFQQGRLQRMPTEDWATEARYTPGQVWAAPSVPNSDVNPRPLNPHRPTNGLIGCYSADEKTILAMAFDPYQELFQGVIRCLHSDFRLGGLEPGQTKTIRGKIYVVEADVPALLKRYQKDFATK